MDNSLVTLEIRGKNVKRFIATLHKRGILFYFVSYSNFDRCAFCRVRYFDYLEIKKIKTIYEIKLVELTGALKVFDIVKRHLCFLLFFILGIFLIFFYSNIIFSVSVVHNSKEVRDFLEENLAKWGIKKYSFVVSFNEKEEIVKNILMEHADYIEWMDLTRVGTKYEARIEVRKIKKEDEGDSPRDLIAKKKGIILSIEAESGEVLKKVNDYVHAGDIIVSGAIHKNDEIKDYVHAKGRVFAEVWYMVTVEVPPFYRESSKTGKKEHVLTLACLDKEIRLFSHFDTYLKDEVFSFGSNLFPCGVSLNLESETKEVDVLYTHDVAIEEAYRMARNKLLATLGADDEIIYEKGLKNYEKNSKIVVEIFFKVKEDITSYMEIVPKE